MLKAGLGEVYTSAGAEYSYVGLEKFQKAEEEARLVQFSSEEEETRRRRLRVPFTDPVASRFPADARRGGSGV